MAQRLLSIYCDFFPSHAAIDLEKQITTAFFQIIENQEKQVPLFFLWPRHPASGDRVKKNCSWCKPEEVTSPFLCLKSQAALFQKHRLSSILMAGKHKLQREKGLKLL